MQYHINPDLPLANFVSNTTLTDKKNPTRIDVSEKDHAIFNRIVIIMVECLNLIPKGNWRNFVLDAEQLAEAMPHVFWEELPDTWEKIDSKYHGYFAKMILATLLTHNSNELVELIRAFNDDELCAYLNETTYGTTTPGVKQLPYTLSNPHNAKPEVIIPLALGLQHACYDSSQISYNTVSLERTTWRAVQGFETFHFIKCDVLSEPEVSLVKTSLSFVEAHRIITKSEAFKEYDEDDDLLFVLHNDGSVKIVDDIDKFTGMLDNGDVVAYLS